MLLSCIWNIWLPLRLEFMLKRLIHTSTCVAIVLLLLLNGTSHDFLHSFSGHEDTVDCNHNHQEHSAAFEQQHHHCDFLDLQSPTFLLSSNPFLIFISVEHSNHFAALHLPFVSSPLLHTALRGPPSC